MAEYFEIHNRLLDPYGKQMFDFNTRYSQTIPSRELDRLLEVVENDCILKGIELIDYSATTSSFTASFSSGKIIHDRVYFEILENVTIDFEIYPHFDIVGINQTDNYFEINDKYLNLFIQNDDFAVVNSTGNNNLHWITIKSEYVSGKTRIYVDSDIPSSVIDGQIIYRVAKDTSTTAMLVSFTKFQYLKLPEEQSIQFCLDYVTTSGESVHGWSLNENRNVLDVFTFEKNIDDTEIIPSSLRLLTETELESLYQSHEFNVYGRGYGIRNHQDLSELIDGGEL